VKDLPQAKVCPFRDPGFGRLAHDHPKSCASGMAISWTKMFAFEPRLVARVVGKPESIVAALRVTKEHRIASPALKVAPQVVGFGDPAGLTRADSICGARPGPGASANELEFWGMKRQISCSSALVLSAVEFHGPVRSRFLSGQNRKSQFWGPLPQNEPFRHHCLPRLSETPIQRLMFHVPVGADLCRPPWQTEILIRNTNVGPWGLAPGRLP